MHREHLPYRSFAVLDKDDFIETAGGLKAPRDSPGVIIVFNGQGAQWAEMGKELIHSDPNFRGDILAMDRKLRALKHPPCWNIMGEHNQPCIAKLVRCAN